MSRAGPWSGGDVGRICLAVAAGWHGGRDDLHPEFAAVPGRTGADGGRPAARAQRGAFFQAVAAAAALADSERSPAGILVLHLDRRQGYYISYFYRHAEIALTNRLLSTCAAIREPVAAGRRIWASSAASTRRGCPSYLDLIAAGAAQRIRIPSQAVDLLWLGDSGSVRRARQFFLFGLFLRRQGLIVVTGRVHESKPRRSAASHGDGSRDVIHETRVRRRITATRTNHTKKTKSWPTCQRHAMANAWSAVAICCCPGAGGFGSR